MKARILAAFLMEHPDLEVIRPKKIGWLDIVPSVSTALYADITDKEENVIVKQDEDFIFLDGVEL